MYKETMHHEAGEDLEHGQSTIPKTAVSISDLETAMAEFLGVRSPRPQAVQSSPSASSRNSTRKPKPVRVSNVFLDGAFAEIEMNGTETSTKRNTGNEDFGDQIEDEELRAFCRRQYGPALDRFAQRNFGISPSDDYEDTEEDKELRAFCRRMYGPSIDKFVERNFGLDADGNPLASSSASKDASKAASSKKKSATLKR